MTKSNPIVFFGSDAFSAVILQALLAEKWTVGLVVTRPRREKGRGRRDTSHPVLDLAQSSKLRTLIPERWGDQTMQELTDTNADLAVLASFGMLLPKSVLETFSLGIINVHPSLLPRWRGASPIEAALLHGDNETGVSLMKLVEKMDAGPIYAQQTLPLTGLETKPDLEATLAKLGGDLLVKELPNIVKGTTKPTPQPKSGVTYAPMINKNDSIIDWTKPAQEIERQIRAYQDWPQSRTEIYGRDVIIEAAQVHRMPSRDLAAGEPYAIGRSLCVATGQGSLKIERIKPAGKQAMTGSAFLNGYAPSV